MPRSSIELISDALDAHGTGEIFDPGSMSSPDGAMTVLFCDLESVPAIVGSPGAEPAPALLVDHAATIRRTVARYQGQIAKSHDFGFMCTFASAHAGLHCAAALLETIEISPRAVRFRAGLHSGFVIVEGEDHLGRNVMLAARIAELARGGEILVSAALKEYTEDDPRVRFEHRGRLRLRGLRGEHDVYLVRSAEG